MSILPNLTYPFQIGGLLEKDALSYVVRQADQQLYQALKGGKFCYVLAAPQMGKSSLRVRTMSRLQGEGIACGVIDLNLIGSHALKPEEWYLGFACQLGHSFEIPLEILSWWRERQGISPVQRLSELFDQVLLPEISPPIVILIDNLECLLPLDFREDFLALLEACYDQRMDNPEYRRLSFALMGVAHLSQLRQNSNRHLFNIATEIDLPGFQIEQVEPLARGLATVTDNPQEILEAVLAWTGGQPLLTQKLCQLVVTSDLSFTPGTVETSVEQLVRAHIIDNWTSQDRPRHLQQIRDRLLSQPPLWELYQQILQQGSIPIDGTAEQGELELSGLVVRQNSHLRVANPIYQEVFNLSWLEQALASVSPTRDWTRKETMSGNFVSPLLQKTRTLRLGLTILIVSLLTVVMAVVVTENASQRVRKSADELKQIEQEIEQEKQKQQQVQQEIKKGSTLLGVFYKEFEAYKQNIAQSKQEKQQLQQEVQQATVQRQQLQQELQNLRQQIEQSRQAQQQAQQATVQRQSKAVPK